MELPTGAVTDDVILIYTPVPTYPLPGEMQLANHAFDLVIFLIPSDVDKLTHYRLDAFAKQLKKEGHLIQVGCQLST